MNYEVATKLDISAVSAQDFIDRKFKELKAAKRCKDSGSQHLADIEIVRDN